MLENARSDHKKVVQERIDHIGKMSDTVKVTEELFAISKEMAEMEAEIYELKQKKEFTSHVKQVLDSWVRQEAAVRESEQRKLSKQVIERVTAQLKDPKIVTFD